MEPQKIIKLDETVINRIAAGEVIQRPANALKEMIENSLDAKSTNIQITVKNGGLKLLQIQDNGTGIRREDFEIVCERFTTSKLREFEDLSSISTYGFRGEALASISHVAHLTITSKTASDKCAYKASYVDSKLKANPVPTAANQGTQIVVEDLFYNMQVRKMALRSPAEEYQKIFEVVSKYAVHNSKTGFGLKKHGENNDIKTSANSSHIDNIRVIFGNSIARELIEIDLENQTYKFKVHGFVTNPNYSTKKFTFLLFINHRLVESQSLKKCLDQVYETYLPKNMHPFVYLSLELDPKCVDVNVHPTKHEVHFFNEEQIVELIMTAVEAKLLGSNNSRVFYTQAKLPGAKEVLETSTSNANKTIYAKEFIRTDAAEQKITKFFGAPLKKNPSKDVKDDSFTENDYEAYNKEFLKRTEDLENMIHLNKSVAESPPNSHSQKSPRNSQYKSALSQMTRIETNLISILELRKEIEEDTHRNLRELFAQHVFVGAINCKQSLIQHSTKLYLCNTQKIMQELFYQFVLYNFQNFGIIKLLTPLPLHQLAMMALELPEVGWTPDDGPKPDLANKIAEILTERSEMMQEYFAMEIDSEGNLKSLPLLLENYLPDMTGLPVYVLRLASEVNWDSEKECFKTFAVETGLYYSQLYDEKISVGSKWKWTTEHVFYPAIKKYFLPPKNFTENASVLQIADLPALYKVFERC